MDPTNFNRSEQYALHCEDEQLDRYRSPERRHGEKRKRCQSHKAVRTEVEPMRLVLLAFGLIGFLVALSANSEEQANDPYWLDLVKNELNMRSSGMNVQVSFTQKNLPKLGDCVGIALLKLVDTSQMVEPKTLTASLSIIRDAFASPDLIAVKSDKEPKVTVCFLGILAERVKDRQLLLEVQRTKEFVQQTAK
jgi:hypothetical protein